jgi:SAM-dependent methyltransferase
MARVALTARDYARRLRGVRDDLLYPEATTGTDQWQRVVLNQVVRERLISLSPATCDAAEISGDARADLDWRSFTSLDFPAFDVCAPRGDEGTYDVVICEQVIEHVIDPFLAVRNLRALTRPGGYVIVSTPFLIRVHELPAYGMRDYWRFTPNGMRQLLESAGLTVEEIGSWGNRRVVVGNFDRWPSFRRWHPLGNEPDLPVQVWGIARNS